VLLACPCLLLLFLFFQPSSSPGVFLPRTSIFLFHDLKQTK
jgi:hypothetical protein